MTDTTTVETVETEQSEEETLYSVVLEWVQTINHAYRVIENLTLLNEENRASFIASLPRKQDVMGYFAGLGNDLNVQTTKVLAKEQETGISRPELNKLISQVEDDVDH